MEDHWGRLTVEALAGRHIVKGKGASVFDPKGEISRAEFAALLVRYFDLVLKDEPSGFSHALEYDFSSLFIYLLMSSWFFLCLFYLRPACIS